MGNFELDVNYEKKDEDEPLLNQEIQPKQEQKFDVKKEIFGWVEAIVVSVVVVSIVLTFVFRFAQVDGTSMVPTLQDQDRLIISNAFYKTNRGDVVVIGRDNNTPLVKRIIGISGDKIYIDFDKSEVYVNDVLLTENYINAPTTLKQDVEFPITVPKGHIFVMGDNRNKSDDSRHTTIGMIKEENIFGKVIFRIAPFDKIGVIK